jgi:hypothetical protein
MDKLFKKHISPTMIAFSLQFILYFPLYSQTIPSDSLYLSQTPPGYTPKIFNIPFSRAYPGDRLAISPDGKGIYYGELYPSPTLTTLRRIKYFTYSNAAWRGPSILFDSCVAPAFSVTGDTLFFEKDESDHSAPFVSVRKDSGWSAPSRFTRGFGIHGLQTTNSGNYYASIVTSLGGVDQGKLSKVVIHDSDVSIRNQGIPSGNENDFFISRDESFTIFTTPDRGGLGQGDLFISYRKNDSSWTNPKNLGSPLSTKDWEHGPYVTPDNKYLIFLRTGATGQVIYWAQIDKLIDSLKHTNFDPYLKSQIPNQTYIVGLPFTFRIADNTFFDDDGNNTLTYSTTLSNGNPLPSWLSFNSSTRTFSGLPSGSGRINIKVIATDDEKATAHCTFSIDTLLLKTEDLDKYLGIYSSKQFPSKATITKYNFTLIAQATGQLAFPLEATEKDKFQSDDGKIMMEFNTVQNELTIRQGGEKFLLTKEK